MPFHVELRRSFHRAWAFNLDAEKLRETVVDPWRAGRPVELGEREWDPQEATLTILEGPELEPADLALGRGWGHAERSGRDVTAHVLAEAADQTAAVAALGSSPAAQLAITALLTELGVHSIDWAVLREPAEAPAKQPELLAAVVAVDDPDPPASWLFEAGVAVGAFGARAIVVQLGETPLPAELAGLTPVSVDAGQPASVEALAEQLRRIGYPIAAGKR